MQRSESPSSLSVSRPEESRGMKRTTKGSSEPLRWRITEQNGRLVCVLSEECSPLLPGEVLLWEGVASHIVDAYRRARQAGHPIVLTREEFRLKRTPKPSVPSRRVGTQE